MTELEHVIHRLKQNARKSRETMVKHPRLDAQLRAQGRCLAYTKAARLIEGIRITGNK